MKLFCLSDLHLDRNSISLGRDLSHELVDFLNSVDSDAILISGDFATGYLVALELIHFINENVNKPFYFIPGNHDAYHSTHSFWEAYHTLTSHTCCISNKVIPLTNDYCLVGDLGWFDMSLSCNLNPVNASSKNRIWTDENIKHLPSSNEAATQFFIEKWKKQLHSIDDKKIIFASHFVPWENFTLYKDGDDLWNYQTGLLGSKHIGNLLLQFPLVDYVIFGHTHNRFGVVDDLFSPTIICSPLGEVKDWKTADFLYEVEQSGVIISI